MELLNTEDENRKKVYTLVKKELPLNQRYKWKIPSYEADWILNSQE
jgi:hypothetical protein